MAFIEKRRRHVIETNGSPQARRKALTSRPLLLTAGGRAITSGNRTTLYLTRMHADVFLGGGRIEIPPHGAAARKRRRGDG